MANLIILEGLSRTGKSTITKKLSERYGFNNISLKEKMPECVESLPDFYHGIHVISNEFFRSFNDKTFILDRSFISELVYSRFFGRKTHIKEDTVVGDLLLDNNFVIFNLQTIHKNYMDRTPKDRRIYSFSEFNKQKDSFYWYFEHYKNIDKKNCWTNRFIEIDTDENSINETIDIIETHLIQHNIIKNKVYETQSSDSNR
jgi:thymidylate kinase